jgi:aryl carrier-like protein
MKSALVNLPSGNDDLIDVALDSLRMKEIKHDKSFCSI